RAHALVDGRGAVQVGLGVGVWRGHAGQRLQEGRMPPLLFLLLLLLLLSPLLLCPLSLSSSLLCPLSLSPPPPPPPPLSSFLLIPSPLVCFQSAILPSHVCHPSFVSGLER